MKRLALFILMVAAGCAGAADQRVMPMDTRWLLRVEVRRVLDGDTGDLLRQFLTKPDVALKIAEVEKFLGVKLLKDIQSVTLFGKDASEANTIVAVQGNFDRLKIEGVLRALGQHSEQSVGSRIIHKWFDNGSAHVACFASERLVLVASADAAIKQCLDTLDGKILSASLDDDAASEGTLIYCAAREIQKLKTGAPNAAVLKQLSEIRLLIDLNEKQIGVKVNAKLSNDVTANHVKNLAEGLKSLAMLNAEDEPAAAGLAGMVQVQSEGNSVKLSVKVPFETVGLLILAAVNQAAPR